MSKKPKESTINNIKKSFEIMVDKDNRIFFKERLNMQEEYYTDNINDMQCINSFLNTFINMVNEEHQKNNELKKEIQWWKYKCGEGVYDEDE